MDGYTIVPSGQGLEEVSRDEPHLQRTTMIDQLMTIEEVARYMRVSRFTVYRLAKERFIPATKIGRQWRFQREEIDRWVKDQSQQGRYHIL